MLSNKGKSLVKVACNVYSSLEIWSLIEAPCREDRSMIMRHVPPFLGITPRGKHWRLGIGSSEKGLYCHAKLPFLRHQRLVVEAKLILNWV